MAVQSVKVTVQFLFLSSFDDEDFDTRQEGLDCVKTGLEQGDFGFIDADDWVVTKIEAVEDGDAYLE